MYHIVAFRGERGSYNAVCGGVAIIHIVAFRGERGSYNAEVITDEQLKL